MKHMLSTAAADLAGMRRRSGADQQTEDPIYIRMAASGHPYAEPYRRLRAFFDILDYPSNSGARMFSYKNEHEHAEYWTPRLLLGAGGLANRFVRFGKVGPGHPGWPHFVAVAASAGWPGDAGPGLWTGSWFVHTGAGRLRDELFALRSAGVSVRTLDYRGPTLALNLAPSAAAVHQQGLILQALHRHHHEWILPRNRAAAATPVLSADEQPA